MHKIIISVIVSLLSIAPISVAASNLQRGDYGYLYCHMSDLGEWTAFAISRDGYHYKDLISGQPVFKAEEHARIEGGTRDAYITRKHDGSGYVMVTTDMCVAKSHVWDNYGIDLLQSDDLIHWTSVTFDYRQGARIFCDSESEDVYKDWSTINRVWAPQIFWDPDYLWPDGKQGGYMIYYSMLNRPEEAYDRMYYSYADESFTHLTKPRLLFDWGYATIDADINYLESDGLYHMLIKKEGGKPGIYTATSEHLTKGWGEPVEDDYVSFEGDKKCEGSSAFQLIGEDTWCVAYIQYSDKPKHYRICKADKNLRHFHSPVDIEGVTGPQHGSFMRLTEEEYKRLEAWSDSMMTAKEAKGTFECGQGAFLLNGQPFVVKAAEVHYPRIPRPYWEHRIKMCRALGMNTVCIYVFWNYHEPQMNHFTFEDQADVAEFCRLAQKNGMYVIVRPGPYVCAEWEMGGLPWWLLKKKDIQLRERDPFFMERVKIFEQKVGEQLAPLTIQNGGPIIMIQVENEYGSYGEDKPYVSEIRDCLRSIYGDKVALFQCDWSSNFTKNGLDDLVWTMNFGTGADIDQQFKRLGELRPHAPKMCSEFWSGWFDKWGAQHETRPAEDMVQGIDEMLSKGISFSLYMTHGGTSFGHWAGANSPGFAPDVTSYDYDAPINEYGQPTEKYFLLRQTMQKYTDHKLPAIPKAAAPIITIPKFKLEKAMRISDYLTIQRQSRDILTMEDMGCGWGMIEYTTTLPEVPVKSVLTLNDCHDFAQVYIDSEYIGKIDRVKNEKSINLPPVKKGQALNILVEAMGRINFGRAIKDFKGITNEVLLQADIDGHETTWNLKNWNIISMNDDYQAITKEMSQGHDDLKRPETIYSDGGYYRGYFNLKKVGDTFLNFETWGKGQVWVNGHAMGRIWSIGPQQTLYVPGCWLNKGKNEIIVLDVIGPKEPTVWGQATPELNKLQLEKSNKRNNIGDKPDLNSATPIATSQFKAGNGWQIISFNAPQKGRYLAIECCSTQKEGDRVAIAELYLQGSNGERLSREPWTTKYADSEDDNGNHTGDKVFDLQESTFWQTEKGSALPHLLVIDLGLEQTVTGLEYLPRAEQGAPGSVKDYRIYIY